MLMGDMIGDLRMADGMRGRENVVTIGFLNSKVLCQTLTALCAVGCEEVLFLPQIQDSFTLYRDNFDIVLFDDQTMDIPVCTEFCSLLKWRQPSQKVPESY